MKDNLSIVITMLVFVVLIVIFPLYNYFERQDDMSYNLALKETTAFVDEVLNSGYVDQQMYDDFVDKLAATGNIYDIQLEGHEKVKVKEDEDGNTYNEQYLISYNDDIFSSIDSNNSVNMSNITKKNIINGAYFLNEGDQFYVKLKNANTTMAGAIFNTIVPTSKKDRIVVNYGGIVKNTSWNQVRQEYNAYKETFTVTFNFYETDGMVFNKNNKLTGFYVKAIENGGVTEVGPENTIFNNIIWGTDAKYKIQGVNAEDTEKLLAKIYTIKGVELESGTIANETGDDPKFYDNKELIFCLEKVKSNVVINIYLQKNTFNVILSTNTGDVGNTIRFDSSISSYAWEIYNNESFYYTFNYDDTCEISAIAVEEINVGGEIYTFEGWYDEDDDKIGTNNILEKTIDKNTIDKNTHQKKFYAKYKTPIKLIKVIGIKDNSSSTKMDNSNKLTDKELIFKNNIFNYTEVKKENTYNLRFIYVFEDENSNKFLMYDKDKNNEMELYSASFESSSNKYNINKEPIVKEITSTKIKDGIRFSYNGENYIVKSNKKVALQFELTIYEDAEVKIPRKGYNGYSGSYVATLKFIEDDDGKLLFHTVQNNIENNMLISDDMTANFLIDSNVVWSDKLKNLWENKKKIQKKIEIVPSCNIKVSFVYTGEPHNYALEYKKDGAAVTAWLNENDAIIYNKSKISDIDILEN